MSETNTPNNPPLLAEDALYDAEKRVLNAFRRGWEDGKREVFVLSYGAVDWQDAILRADFLRSLFLGSYDTFAPRSVIISFAQIEGRLDLDYCEPCFPLEFFECIFPEGISLQSATIPELGLVKCRIYEDKRGVSLSASKMRVISDVSLNNQFRAYGEVNLNGADIGGQLSCAGSHFEKGLTAQNLKTGEDVFLSEKFNSNGKVSLFGANIGGQLVCIEGHFKKGLKANNLKTSADVLLGGDFNSNDKVILFSADIGGHLYCDNGHFEKGLDAQNLKTGANVRMRNKFKSNGKVLLSDADIGGGLYCDGGYFGEGLDALNLKTGASMYLSNGFKSNGKVVLFGANVGKQLYCDGGYFKEGLEAQKLKTGDDVSLSIHLDFYYEADEPGESAMYSYSDFESYGEVDLSGANIGRGLYCESGRFEKCLKAQNLKTGADVYLSSVFNEGVDLSGADIGRGISCGEGRFDKFLKAQNLKTGAGVCLSDQFESTGEMNLSGADIGGELSCNVGHFKERLIADGLHYQNINLGVKKGLSWLGKMSDPEKEFSSQPYEQLMTAYRHMGEPDWAREIGFELEKKRHEQSKGLWRAWYSILNCTIGYGYRPFRSLGWAVGLVTAGFLLFSSGHDGIVSRIAPPYLSAPAFLDDTILANKWIPSEGEAHEYWRKNNEQVPQGYPKFNPIIYSLEAAFPVLPLGQLGKWHLDNPFLRFVRWVLTFVGSALLAILALFGVGFLGPNRKSEGDSG